ncbi:hypothetical protein GCM10025880_59270 [Methylorubrum aminovorans]|nr:hypothetical protein GCM10025880_59270 [Methylorubrum aminovorans]
MPLGPGKRIDEAAGIERQHHVYQRSERDRGNEGADEAEAFAPTADDEGEDAADGIRAPGEDRDMATPDGEASAPEGADTAGRSVRSGRIRSGGTCAPRRPWGRAAEECA